MNADSKTVLNAALPEIRAHLKGKSFRARGMTFTRTAGNGNTLILNLQKSSSSTRQSTRLALNYGVVSALVARSLLFESANPWNVSGCHWRRRFSRDGHEQWFSIGATDSPMACAGMLIEAIDLLLPDLERHVSDEILLEDWLRGSSPGIGEMQRQLYAAILARVYGSEFLLDKVVRELRALVSGTDHERLIERQLSKAGIV